jgi:creatinine amidohydrolase
MLEHYLPGKINSGCWITAYTLYALRDLPASTQFVLPIASLGAPYEVYAELGNYVLPPLFHEALSGPLKQDILDRIFHCFPNYSDPENNRSRLQIIELPPREPPTITPAKVLAFSVDTAVEEHGPHLPLGTDTIQSYGVLEQLRKENSGHLLVGHPVDYGQLTWGLPFGFSIDFTADLLTKYVRQYVNAMQRWLKPQAMYVVDVHGSIVHRQAIVRALQDSNVRQWAFRWLHEPLTEFASKRNDQHAGGVETALVEFINNDLVDPTWWPARIDEIARRQMSLETAIELTPDLPRFGECVDREQYNGIVGDIQNYHSLDATDLFERMLTVAREDVSQLLAGNAKQDAGANLW